jgi:hypothetical protein
MIPNITTNYYPAPSTTSQIGEEEYEPRQVQPQIFIQQQVSP